MNNRYIHIVTIHFQGGLHGRIGRSNNYHFRKRILKRLIVIRRYMGKIFPGNPQFSREIKIARSNYHFVGMISLPSNCLYFKNSLLLYYLSDFSEKLKIQMIVTCYFAIILQCFAAIGFYFRNGERNAANLNVLGR